YLQISDFGFRNEDVKSEIQNPKSKIQNDAISCYIEILRIDPRASLPADQQFALAAALEEQGEYRSAVAAFQVLLRNNTDAPEAERALLRMGSMYIQRLDSPREAADVFQTFLNRYSH